jgi:GAF domain-containing protein
LTLQEPFQQLLSETEKICSSNTIDMSAKMQNITELLVEKVDHYEWVGFYLVDQEKKDELVLGPYTGDPTEHVRIPFGRGICGRVADTKQELVIQDVGLESNYLSCSPKVKSEIVEPIFKNGEFIGEIDIDSHKTNPFTEQDSIFLQKICLLVSQLD